MTMSVHWSTYGAWCEVAAEAERHDIDGLVATLLADAAR